MSAVEEVLPLEIAFYSTPDLPNRCYLSDSSEKWFSWRSEVVESLSIG